ncbi:benzoate-CoA ligase family protein [Actinocrispum wychmicini]|nr:benzoate-CoA ligase family protein [Actinocrispum wychmicini]
MRYEDVPASFNIASYFVDRNDPGRTALITGDGPVTYGDLATRVNQAGNALLELGVRQGDRVLIAMSDGLDFVVAWYAAQKIGAVTAEVYTFLPVKDYRYFVEYVSPKVVLADRTTAAKLIEAGAPNLIVGLDTDRQPSALAAAPTSRDDVAIWKFTTGSTGAPKACVLAARSPLLSFDWYARGVLDIRPDDVVLPVPKLFFGYARDMTALFPFGVGGAGIVFPERTTADRIFELIAEHRPTILVNVPTMMGAMVSHPDAARQDLSSLRLCTSAGEALPAELHRRWMDTFGVEVLDGIGSSEAYHIYLSNRPGDARRGSLGQVVPGYRAQVVDLDGRPVPDGEVGRLEITGETVALEYFQAPEKTAATFPRPHTVRSGDLVTRDQDGFFYYQGRADDLLKVGGVWVAPAEIENCLMAHPAVTECAVVGYQENGLVKPRAFVVSSDVTAAELQDFVKKRLSPHKYPRDVQFVPELPKTASGKLDRRALRGDSP